MFFEDLRELPYISQEFSEYYYTYEMCIILDIFKQPCGWSRFIHSYIFDRAFEPIYIDPIVAHLDKTPSTSAF